MKLQAQIKGALGVTVTVEANGNDEYSSNPELDCLGLTHSWVDKGVHTFPKGMYPKVNVIAQLEFELAHYDSAVHRLNHYTTRTPH